MNAVQNYLDNVLSGKQGESRQSFRFSITVTEEEKNRLEHVANDLNVSRAEFAAELLTSALIEAELRLDLRPKDDADLADRANWSEKKRKYVEEFLPVLHFASQHAAGEISQDEFWNRVKIGSNGTLHLREE